MNPTVLDSLRHVAFLCLLFAIIFVDFEYIWNYFTKTPKMKFIGDEYWHEYETNLCDDPEQDVTWTYPDSLCFVKIEKFEEVRIEVLSWTPPLVIYRNIFTQKQVDNYLALIEKQQLEYQDVVDDEGNNYTSTVRQANGTTTPADEFPEAQSLVDTVTRLIPAIDFKIAEDITALSYNKGGHYATHLDFLEYKGQSASDPYYLKVGDRMATLIMVFKKADIGGGTVFPYLDLTVRPNAGDAFLWFNMKRNLEVEESSEHGGCPVIKGNKVISTIWIRTIGQPIFGEDTGNRSFHASVLLR